MGASGSAAIAGSTGRGTFTSSYREPNKLSPTPIGLGDSSDGIWTRRGAVGGAPAIKGDVCDEPPVDGA